MAAALNFFAGTNQIQNLSGSGLGFYGSSGFGASVAVGAWQGRTYITNGAGTSQGPEGWNIQFLDAASGIIGQVGTGIALTAIPNYQATLNIRLTNDTAVNTQNAALWIYDRYSTNNPASGVTTKAAELIHPTVAQSNNGSGDTAWVTPAGSGTTLSLAPSPGCSGHWAGNGNNGSTWADTNHDWYVALSASPNSIGSKTQYGLYVYVEYL